MAKRGYILHDLVALRTHTWKRTRKGRSYVIRIQQRLIEDNGGRGEHVHGQADAGRVDLPSIENPMHLHIT